nr:hypothetical protein [Tanacetum cinerariifolium]
GLKPSWEYGHQRHVIIVDGKEMAFRDFLYAETDEDLSFHPKEPSPNFGISSPSMKGECEVLKEREKARDNECEELKAKCEAVMADFDNNPTVKVLHKKIADVFVEVKEHKASLGRILLKSKTWAGYHVILLTLESKVASLEAEKAKLEATEASLRQEVENVKHDRVEVISKVVAYVAIELVQSNDMGMLIVKRVSSAIFFGRCQDFQEVMRIKDLFDLTKIKGYRPLYKSLCIRRSPSLQEAIDSAASSVTPPFLHIAAEANMGIGAGVYDSWKLQGDVEGLWDEFAKLEASMKMWESLVEPRHS